MTTPRNWNRPKRHSTAGSLRELAQSLGMSYSSLKSYSQLGIIPKGADGYSTKDVCAILEERWQRIQSTRKQPDSPLDVEIKRERLAGLKMENWRKRNQCREVSAELMNRESVEDGFRQLAAHHRRIFFTLAPKLAPVFAKIHSPEKIQADMERAFRAAALELEESVSGIEIQHPTLPDA